MAQRPRGGQRVFRAIKSDHGLTAPGRIGGFRPAFISQPDRLGQDILQDLPGNLFAGLGDRAAMNGFGLGPQTTAASVCEEFTGFSIDAPITATAGERKQKNDQFWKRNFANSNERVGVIRPR